MPQSTKPTLKHILAAIILMLSLTLPVAADQFEDSTAAYRRHEYKIALRLVRPLADQGIAAAQYFLGVLYNRGQGVPQSYVEAMKWFHRAADQGYPEAQLSLGVMYADGRGVPQDHIEAAKWYRLAADQGDTIGQAMLGLMYAKGLGVPQDYVRAHMWLNLSAIGGNKDSVESRDLVEKRMTPVQVAEAQKLAREWKPTRSPISARTREAAPARTQELDSAPQILVGRWGNSPRQCRSYHRKSDDISIIDNNTYTFCGGSACEATILGYQKTPDGYDLKLGGGSNVWQLHVRVINENAVEMIRDASPGEMLVRCTKSDAIAGIGLGDTSGYENNGSLDAVFAGYYALAIPTQCPHLAANVSAAESVIKDGVVGWEKFLLKQPNNNYRSFNQDVEVTKRSAESAVRRDASEIKDFCDEVLGAFGNDGRVSPKLIKDPRKKS